MKWIASLRARTLLLVLVILPTLGYGLYLSFIASDRYVSEAVIAVRQAGADGGTVPGAALLLGGLNPASREDTLYLKAFVHSRAVLNELDTKLGLRRHYAQPRADRPFMLDAQASQEEFAAYFRRRVEVGFDPEATLLRIRVQGFEPAFAQRVNQAVLDASERFVNETSQRMARERLRFAEGELALAGDRLQKAKSDVLAFQTRHRMLDPGAQALASGAISAELQATRTRFEAELGSLLSYLNEDAYQMQALRSRIAALDRQIDAERRKATSDDRRGDRISALAVQFQGLQLQAQFAQDAYKLAAVAVENARIDASRKIKSLLVVEPPSLPDEAEYPLKLYNLMTLFVVCCLLFGITSLVLTTVREHQD